MPRRYFRVLPSTPLRKLRRALPAWIRALSLRRHGADRYPHCVPRGRIYILPTRFGYMLGALLLAMLIAGLNYSSNLALAFTFLLAGLAIVAMHRCHRNLQELKFTAPVECDGFAGSNAAFPIHIDNPSPLPRYDLELLLGDSREFTQVSANSHRAVEYAVPTQRRSVAMLSPWEIRTCYPLGWFRAWTYVHAPLTIFTAPSAQGSASPPASSDEGETEANSLPTHGDEEFAGLRPYRPGDALKHIDWKSIARGREPAVKHYSAQANAPEWLEWDSLAGLPAEVRLSQLCRWVLEYDAAGRRYGLRLPSRSVTPDSGGRHRRECLRALAAFEG